MKTIPSASLTEPITLLLAAVFLIGALAGCGDSIESPSGPSLSTKVQPKASGAAIAPMEPIFAAWHQGDRAGAVARVVETDWNQWPLFAPGTTLSLSEAQFMGLSAAGREAKSPEMLSQVRALKEIAEAVSQFGRDAAARRDITQARKHFSALKQLGDALDRSECLTLVRLTGQAIRKKAAKESPELGL